MQTNNAVILARVSSRSQEDEGYSLDSQLKLLRAYCKDKNLAIVKEFKITETASKEQSRKIFHELLKFIAKNKINHLAVEKTDRLTRNFRDAIAIDDWLDKDGERMLHAVKENIQLCKDSRSDVKFMWSIHLAVAKKYTDNLREEAMKGWAEKLAQGWLPASPPPGYKTVIDSGKRIHVPDPNVAPKIKQIFELYLLPEQSLSTLAEEMAAIGLRTGKGSKFKSGFVGKRILSNPFYIGINSVAGKEYPGAQEPIIDIDLFNAVQEKIGQRSRSFRVTHDPIFKGVLRCENCKSMLYWSKHKGRYYGCCAQKTEACKGRPYLREDWLEMIVISMLEEIDDTASKIIHELETVLRKGQIHDVGAHRERLIKSLKAEIKRLHQMGDRLYDDKLAGAITEERYIARNEHYDQQISDAQDRLKRLLEAQKRAQPTAPEPESDNPIVNLWLLGSPNEKRMILAHLFRGSKVGDTWAQVSTY